LIELHAKLAEFQKDNLDYASGIADLEYDLASVNTILRIMQAATNHISLPIAKPIKLPYPPKSSGQYKEILNFISKVSLRLAGESS
jgi:hypothetical protein